MKKLRYLPLDDLPHTEPDSFDAAHISETREVLKNQLEVALSENQPEITFCGRIDKVWQRIKVIWRWRKIGKNKSVKKTLSALFYTKKQIETAVRIGLFGGLGQGKTSTLKQATDSLSILQIGCFGKIKFRKARIYWFDTAHYKPDEMEYEFDRIFRSWGMLSRVFLVIGFAALIAIILFVSSALDSVESTKEFSSVFKTITSVIAISYASFKFLGFWFRDLERSNLFSNKKEVFTRLFLRPDVFIVDNLDRATIEQQIAIFRALYKYSQNLPIAFVICMDETSLLQASVSPEHPTKLLRKVINVEIRLPARLPQDAPLLCQAILADCIEQNPELLILSNSSFAGDFSVLVSLLADFSPRIAKRMLNDALADAQKTHLLHSAEDCGAFLRLHMLYAEFPELQQFSILLIRILECKEEIQKNLKIADLAEQFNNDASKLKQLINLSHYVQPLAGNWKRLIGVHSNTKTTTNQQISNNNELPLIENQEAAQSLWEDLNTIKQGYGEQDILKLWGRLGLEPFSFLIWPMFSVMLAHEKYPENRLRLLRWYSKTLDQLTNHTQQGLLRYTLLRYWLGDHQAVSLLPEQELDVLISAIQRLEDHRRIYLLPIINTANVSFNAIFELLVAEPSGDHRIIRDWLNEVSFSDPLVSYSGSPNSSDFLAAIWPTLPADCLKLGWVIKLENQFKLFKILNDLSLLTVAPNSLVSALFTEGNWQRLVANSKANPLLHSLLILLNLDEKWSLKAWQALTINLSEQEKQYRVSELIQYSCCDITQTWSVALLIACDVKDKESIETLLKSVKSLNSPELVKLFIANPDYLLWKIATGNQIELLLSGLISPYNEEWSKIRQISDKQLLDCFNNHNDEQMLIDIFELKESW